MSTTSIKIPDDLKDRLRKIAEARQTSVHAFLLASVQDAADAAERQISFLADAEAADEQMRASGEGYDADEVHSYIHARVRGQQTERPVPKPWRD